MSERLAGRDRDHAGPSSTDPAAGPPDALDQLGRLEQLVEVAAADDPGRIERGVGHPRLARQRARMGHRRRLRLVTAPDLDGHDRLAQLEGPVGEGEEPLGSLEALDEQDDRVGLGVVEAERQVVADVEDDLRAAADDPREADPVARVDEGVGDRARLGDAGHPAAWQVRRDVADVRRAVGDEVDDAHAVRPQQGEAVLARDPGDVRLHRRGGGTPLDDAAPRDDDRRDAGRGRRLGDGRGTQRVERHDRDVRALGQRLERRVARLAVELLVLRIDEVTAGLAVHDPEVVADRLRDPRPRRGPDDGDAAWREQRTEVDHARGVIRVGRRLGHHPTTRSTPRFSSARAMIIRWISEVPSQMRSTRSSRRNRSGANSRM